MNSHCCSFLPFKTVNKAKCSKWLRKILESAYMSYNYTFLHKKTNVNENEFDEICVATDEHYELHYGFNRFAFYNN